MCLICNPPPALRAHPQYRRLLAAEALEVMIVSGRRARPRQVCALEVYERLSRTINAIIDATEPWREVPTNSRRLRTPDPAWSLAMALHARVQGKMCVARAHSIVASRTLKTAPSNMETHYAPDERIER